MLYIFGGLPGTGKTTLSQFLARDRRCVYLRIDTIEHLLRQTGSLIAGSEGYGIAYRLAEDNLRLGLSVVADSVNPLPITRTAWREVALQTHVPFVEIEIVCSDNVEHQHRVENRSTDIAGFELPTWNAVVNRKYERWDTERIVIDTSGQTVEQSINTLQQILARVR
ncbi:conserved domain protein [Leptolyngbya sp. NIES-2104]|nr:conserved domain protein [Leptolyngbya sp. NIES-2104]